MRLCIAIVLTAHVAHAEAPKVAPYDRLFEVDATFTLQCFVQHQNQAWRYDANCTATTCTPDGEYACTVKEHAKLAGADLSRLACTRTRAKGSASSSDEWWVRTNAGLWVAGATKPTKAALAALLATKPYVAVHPIVGTIKPKLDPDGEDDRIDGGWTGDRYCLDSEVGKSNPGWGRWCISAAAGIAGTFHTSAESVIADRCGEPL